MIGSDYAMRKLLTGFHGRECLTLFGERRVHSVLALDSQWCALWGYWVVNLGVSIR